jgi:DNA repair exonuclease SbcCD ATPase subunit
MIFNQLKIQGFKSVGEEQTLIFDDYTGTCSVTGENQAEPSLGANGIGKSAMLSDALAWCYHGKTAIGLKAGNITNWYSDEKCKVECNFTKNKENYTLVRTQNPNSLKLNDKTVTQEELDDLVGLNYDSFLHAIIIPQFSSKFFDLKPEPKLQIFSNILELDKWLSYSAKAKGKADKILDRINNIKSDIDYLDGRVIQAEETDYSDDIEKWQDKQDNEIVELTTNLEAKQEVKEQVKTELDSLIKEHIKAQKEYDAKVIANEKIGDTYGDLLDKVKTLESQYKETSYNGKQLQKEIDKFKEVDEICPYCEQDVTKEYIDDRLNSLISELDECASKAIKQKEKLDVARIEADELDCVLYEESKMEKQLNKTLNEYSNRITKLESNLENHDREVSSVEKRIAKLKNEKNPYLDLKKENEERIKSIKKDRRVKRRALNTENELHSKYVYWVKGFKEIRLFIVEEALQEFEVQVNNNIQRLGLVDWKVKLAVDYETKSKTIRKGFTVLVKSPNNKELVPFTCWSGGESQRLRLAGTLGLIDLISSRTGINPNIEIWDEATSWLSNEGISDFVEVLAERADELDRIIFVIDHRNLNTFGEFTSDLRIIKDGNGSRVV